MPSKLKPQWKSVSPPVVGTFHVSPRDDGPFEITGYFGFIKLHDGGRPKTPVVLTDRGTTVKIDPRAQIRQCAKTCQSDKSDPCGPVIYDGKRVGVSSGNVPYHLNRPGVRKARRKRRKR